LKDVKTHQCLEIKLVVSCGVAITAFERPECPPLARHCHDPRQFRPVLYICVARANLIMSCVYSSIAFDRWYCTVVALRYPTVMRKPFFSERGGASPTRAMPCPPDSSFWLTAAILTVAVPMRDFQVASSPFDPHNGGLFHLPNSAKRRNVLMVLF
jgi:hypothetical protein